VTHRSSDEQDEGSGGPGMVAELLRSRPPMARELPRFDLDRAPSDPGSLFVDWLIGAFDAGVLDAQVVTLSTVDADGLPDARVLVLRDVDVEGAGWLFAVDSDSPKGRQLTAHPVAAMTLYWPPLGRQVRIRGTVAAAPPEVSAAEFLTRSPAARTAALVGRQSRSLPSLETYDEAAEAARRRLAAEPGLVAPSHTVYTLRAQEVEFWQGDPDRRHVRLRFTRSGQGTGSAAWTRTLLWP